MRSEVSSLTSHLSRPPFLTSNPTKPTSSLNPGFRNRPTSTKATSIDIRGQKSRAPFKTARPIGIPEPPWKLLPPAAPQNPFSGETPIFDFQLKGSGTGIPFSLRFVQMRKKRLALSRLRTPITDLGSVGNAVWSLACMLEELQRSVLSTEALAGVSIDTAESVVWLFHGVFFTAPNLMVGLLLLTTKFIALSTENATPNLTIPPPPKIVGYRCWSDIGISDETNSSPPHNGGRLDYERKRMVYEYMIVAEKANSLILSNYAQLLYQYDKDLDRANDYFKWAVSAEPVDGEARSRYALFLWLAREDVEAAEEMFLKAIEVEPGNVYHQSKYAWFLLTTGGSETCYPLDGDGDGDYSRSDLLSDL